MLEFVTRTYVIRGQKKAKLQDKAIVQHINVKKVINVLYYYRFYELRRTSTQLDYIITNKPIFVP